MSKLKSILSSSPDVIRVTSRARADRSAYMDLTPEEREFYRTATMRYETDTNTLYMKAPLAKELKSSDYYAPLFSSQCFVGTMSFAFYKGTPFNGNSCHCYVFDMSKSEEPLEVMERVPEYLYKKQAAKLRKLHPGNPSLVASLLDEWKEEVLAKQAVGKVAEHQHKSEAQMREQRLLNRIRRLEERLLGRVKKDKAPREAMPELDAYITQNKDLIRRTATKIVLVEGKPEAITKKYDPYENKLRTIGRFDDTLKGEHRHMKLYLLVSALKQSVPNFKHDKRYTHSQRMRLKSITGSEQDYCAVFDLTRK